MRRWRGDDVAPPTRYLSPRHKSHFFGDRERDSSFQLHHTSLFTSSLCLSVFVRERCCSSLHVCFTNVGPGFLLDKSNNHRRDLSRLKRTPGRFRGTGCFPRDAALSDACRRGATSPSRKMRRHFPTDRPGLLASPTITFANIEGRKCNVFSHHAGSRGGITGVDRASARLDLAITTPRRSFSSSFGTIPVNFGATLTRPVTYLARDLARRPSSSD